MPQTGVPIDVQTLAAVLEVQSEMLLRLGHYPSPGFKRMARANRDLLKRLREMGDAGTYNAPTPGEGAAWVSARDTARQEHRIHLRASARSLGEADHTDPADEEA